jgi:hypothetical protein
VGAWKLYSRAPPSNTPHCQPRTIAGTSSRAIRSSLRWRRTPESSRPCLRQTAAGSASRSAIRLSASISRAASWIGFALIPNSIQVTRSPSLP